MKKVLSCFTAITLLILLALPASVPAMAADDLFSDKDLTLATVEKATEITLNGESVTISKEGAYVLSGEIAEGSVRVVPAAEGTVYLLLNGVSVHNSSGAALYTENCKKVVLTLADGTVNTFSQGETAPADEDETAPITSRDDLTINGNGALVATGMYKDGISSRDSLKIVSGDITVTAVDDGLVGKDAVIIGGGTVNVASACDGIKATNDEDASRGYVTLAGGDISITTTGTDTTSTALTANGSADGGAPSGQPESMTPPDMPADAPQAADGASGATPPQGRGEKGGGRGGMGGGRGGMGFGGEPEAVPVVSTGSAKGVKAVTTLTVSGATLNISSTDDALHANDIVISGGSLTLASGDDGVHADNRLLISGGTVDVTRSYEGLEAAIIEITGGESSVVASDDGVNGAGGDSAEESTDGWGAAGFGGRDRFSSSTGSMNMSGGRLTVTASGDGVDVNGSIAMSGGEIYVNGPTNSGNGALDYNSDFTMTGGTLIALGASGMAQGVSAPSVAGAMVDLNGSAGTLSVKDGSGNVVLSFEAAISYRSAVIYSDKLLDGQTYTVATPSGEQSVAMSTQGTGGGFGFGRW